MTIWNLCCPGWLAGGVRVPDRHTKLLTALGSWPRVEGFLAGPDLGRDGQFPEGSPPHREPYDLETGMAGLLAAGDVRHGSVKRCAPAVGMAAVSLHRYLARS